MTDTVPVTDTALPRSTPSAESVSAAGIRSFIDALDDAEDIEPHSVMLLRHGRVIAEAWWAPYAPDRVHLLYSLSKSFTSAALGLAIDEALVSLDDTVLSHFPDLEDEVTDPRSRAMRVRDIAAMASGHRADLVDRAEDIDAEDLVRGLLTIPPDEEPGTLFAYNQPCTYALAAIVHARSGQSLTGYLRPRLLDPLGIGTTGWLRDGSGRDLGFSGLHATTEAVAKLGQLHLDGGMWNGTRVLSAEWVAEATRKQVANSDEQDPDSNQGYGFQFWMARHGYRGDGAYGQLCIVLPEYDVVLAITSQTENKQAVLDAAWNFLLPAFDGDTDDAADDALAQHLRTRRLEPAPGSPAPVEASGRQFRAAASNDQPTLTGVEIARDGETWKVTLIEDNRLSGVLGIAEWAVTGSVAMSGGWGADGVLRIDVAFLETPHRLRLDCDSGNGSFRARWVTEPLHGLPLAQFRMPA